MPIRNSVQFVFWVACSNLFIFRRQPKNLKSLGQPSKIFGMSKCSSSDPHVSAPTHAHVLTLLPCCTFSNNDENLSLVGLVRAKMI